MHHVGGCGSTAESGSAAVRWSSCLPCLIIRLIIQTILLYPSGAIWTDEASNVSSLDPSGAVQVDAEHPSRNREADQERRSSQRRAGFRDAVQ
jgi:hypothetical protein